MTQCQTERLFEHPNDFDREGARKLILASYDDSFIILESQLKDPQILHTRIVHWSEHSVTCPWLLIPNLTFDKFLGLVVELELLISLSEFATQLLGPVRILN